MSKLESHFSERKEKYITGSFTAADICLSIWLAQAMVKCEISALGDVVSGWMTGVLTALKACDDSGVSPLLAAMGSSGAAEPSASVDLANNPLVKKLQEIGLEFDVYPHAACRTAEELVSNVPLPSEKETHTKNLFFKDKKNGLFLVTHATSSTFNTKQLGDLLKLHGKVNMRLADEETLDKYLAVKSGCVGPLCIVNDENKEVTLVLDKSLTDGTYDFIHSHPLCNNASVKLKPAALMEYLSKAGIDPAVVDFSVEPLGPDAGGKAPANRPPESKPKGESKEQPKKQQQSNQNKKTTEKGKTLLRLQWKKSENFAMWYSDVIVLSEMISYYDISGCYILRPWSYKIWDLIQQWFNQEVSSLGRKRS
jgi:prolyl-tRNA synthetase